MQRIAQRTHDSFTIANSKARCRAMRRRILEISQRLSALHIAPAFSCLEIVDIIYFGLMRRRPNGDTRDTFLLSKGHGAMAQYAVLEQLGILRSEDLDACCQLGGRLGGHPDYGLPGIEASTGSLGHALPMALGITLANAQSRFDSMTYVVMSDGELMEGSTWESVLLAPSIGARNIVVFIDLNDFISRGQTSVHHPNIYPVEQKFHAFGWDATSVDGHDQEALLRAAEAKDLGRPLAIIAKTVKGKGVSYMENEPIWHFRSPNPEEFKRALAELEDE